MDTLKRVITEEETKKYRNQFLKLPPSVNRLDKLQVAVDEGIPIEYLLQSGIMDETELKLLKGSNEQIAEFSLSRDVDELFNEKEFTDQELKNYKTQYLRIQPYSTNKGKIMGALARGIPLKYLLDAEILTANELLDLDLSRETKEKVFKYLLNKR